MLSYRGASETQGRFIIDKHTALSVFKRLWARQQALLNIDFECIFVSSLKQPAFAFCSGYRPSSLNGTFRRLMRDSGLFVDRYGQARTLYSIRHTYSTLELLENSMDIHTFTRQMDNSAASTEHHYSKLAATLAAGQLAK